MFFSCFTFSQGENNNWYFGNKAGVTFNTNPPTGLIDSEMDSNESTAVVSDSNGNLLFYTNSNTVWNREHEIMTNGANLLGHHSSQQTIVLPKPDSTTLYYLFTMPSIDESTSASFIAYSVIDMSLGEDALNGDLAGQPLGEVVVTERDVLLKNEYGNSFTTKTEAITAVLASDNQSYWVLIPNEGSLYSYKLDASGFVSSPIVSSLGFNLINFGSIKASPILSDDLGYSHLISMTSNSANKWKVYSFDNFTGELTTDYEEEIMTPYSIYSTEFNADGTLLYGVNNDFGYIWVFDMSSKNINLLSGNHIMTGTLQRAGNNNIYVSVNFSSVLYHISNPDSFTSSSLNLDEDNPTNINLGVNNAIFGLPQLIPLPYNILPCDENLVLNTPEIVYNKIYEVSNTITAHQNYNVGLNRDITLNAGNMVEILANSHIESGSVFRAMIEGCNNNTVFRKESVAKNTKPINLDKEEQTNLKIYPNPAKDVINVANSADTIENVTITDMNGRVVKQVVLGVNEGQINISDLSQGVYILNATSNGKTVTEKIVKQ